MEPTITYTPAANPLAIQAWIEPIAMLAVFAAIMLYMAWKFYRMARASEAADQELRAEAARHN